MYSSEPLPSDPISSNSISSDPIAGEPIADRPIAGRPIAGRRAATETNALTMDLRQRLIAAWGVVGVTLLLLQAIVRMAPVALAPWFAGSMTTAQIALYIGWVILNAYLEGHRGFHLRFCPRVVSRAFYLGGRPTLLRVLLAVPFCMSLFHAQRRQRIVSWTLVVVIVGLVLTVRHVPQPWRGIIDGGVVVGLVWGLVSLWWYFLRALVGHSVPPATDLPTPDSVE